MQGNRLPLACGAETGYTDRIVSKKGSGFGVQGSDFRPPVVIQAPMGGSQIANR